MTRGALLLLLVGCGESFTAAEEQRAFVEPTGGEGGEPITHTGGSGAGMAVGGAGAGGLPITVAGAPSSGGSGSMSGSGGSPSGAAGVSGESGAGGMGGSAGEPWMPSRCVEPPAEFTITSPGPWKLNIRWPATSFANLRNLSARYWFSSDGATCEPLDFSWGCPLCGCLGCGTGTARAHIEENAHVTPEGEQTHAIVLDQMMANMSYSATGEHTLDFGGCGDASNDYSAASPERIAVYVAGELLFGCEP